MRRVTAIFEFTEEGWWVAHVEEIPGALSQERTLRRAMESLGEATEMILEEQGQLGKNEEQG